jgi:excisionase family DNA binding protein
VNENTDTERRRTIEQVASGLLPPSRLPVTLTVEETAIVVKKGRGPTYVAVERGEIPSVKLGRSIRIPRAGLLALLGEVPVNGEGAGQGGGYPAGAPHLPHSPGRADGLESEKR